MKTNTRFTFDKVRHDQENNIHLVVTLNAPKKDWKELIENDKPYTVHDVWNLFHRMLSKEYVPYCGHQSNGVPINQALKEVFTCQ